MPPSRRPVEVRHEPLVLHLPAPVRDGRGLPEVLRLPPGYGTRMEGAMSDVVVTVPQRLWAEWLAEGDLPGEPAQYQSHFWVPTLPVIEPGERVYIVAHGRLRGYAPLVVAERVCRLRRDRGCLLREGGAEAVTIDEPIRGFQGWRYRWWDRADEYLFFGWRTEGVR